MRVPRSLFSCLAAGCLALAAPAAAQDALAGLIEESRAPVAESAELLEGIAAQVGSDIVLVSQVRELAGPTLVRAREAGASERDLRMVEAEALERLIERALIKQVVKRAELQATDEEIDGTITDIASENGITTQQLRASVEAQGLPYNLYRERIKGEIEHSKVVNGIVGSRVEITDEEVRALYDQEMAKRPRGGEEFHVRHIVVAPKPDAGGAPAACEMARAARARVVAGEDILAVASGVADAPAELGWVHESELAPWLELAVRLLAAGETSEVSEEPFGCVFVQLAERRSVEPISFEQAKRAIANSLFNQRMQVEYGKFIEEIRAHTYIERKGTVASIEEFERAPAEGTPES